MASSISAPDGRDDDMANSTLPCVPVSKREVHQRIKRGTAMMMRPYITLPASPPLSVLQIEEPFNPHPQRRPFHGGIKTHMLFQDEPRSIFL